MPAPIEVEQYVAGVRSGKRSAIAQAITLVESSRPDHQQAAQDMLVRLLPHAGNACRIGISGVPGAGKSTFIDAFGMMLVEQGHRVAVLAVDPSSTRGGGSILGDKTRMGRLGVHPNAFVRPSPSSGWLGGVARATRESMVVMEAAGYDVVLIETVGVGQSETTVAGMVDTFLLLTLARAGDQLQGIKRGILELAEVIAVNKADGDHVNEAKITARDLRAAIRLLQGSDGVWNTPVLTCSGLNGAGLDEIWEAIQQHRATLVEHGLFSRRRADQQVEWMWSMVREQVLDRLRHDPAVKARVPEVEKAVRDGSSTATLAATELLALARGDKL
jgi:LAO/AO transport system kinase